MKIIIAYISIRENSVEIKDSIYRYSPDGNEVKFSSIDRTDFLTQSASDDNSIFFVGFYKDPKSISFERQVFSWLDCFGNIGGVNEILEITGSLIVGLFSGKIFLFTILSALYQVDPRLKKRSEPEYSEQNSENRQMSLNLDQHDEDSKKNEFNGARNHHKSDKISQIDQNNFKEDSIEFKNHDLNSELVNEAVDCMKTRFRYSFSALDMVYNFMLPFECFDIFYFKKGEEKYTNEFDAVEFARTQRKLKLLMNSLMDENKRFLAPYQKLNAISLLSDSDSNSSDNSAYSKIPRMHSKSEIKKKHRSLINEFFEKYLQEVHTKKDVNLLNGVISNKALANEQLEKVMINNCDIGFRAENVKFNTSNKLVNLPVIQMAESCSLNSIDFRIDSREESKESIKICEKDKHYEDLNSSRNLQTLYPKLELKLLHTPEISAASSQYPSLSSLNKSNLSQNIN